MQTKASAAALAAGGGPTARPGRVSPASKAARCAAQLLGGVGDEGQAVVVVGAAEGGGVADVTQRGGLPACPESEAESEP